MTTEQTVQLIQKASFTSPIQFSLLRGRELEIVNRVRRNPQVYKVDLLALRSPSEKIVNIAWRWWLASLGTLALTTGIVLLLSYLKLDTYVLVSGILGTVASLVLAVYSWRKSTRKQVFYSKHSNVPLVSLHLGVPNKNEFQKFVSLVEAQIESLGKQFNLTQDQELAGEMRTLRRLTNDGIISTDEYASSKEVLFKKH